MEALIVLGALGLVAFAAASFRFAWWRPSVPDRHPRVLMYHMVREPIPSARFNKLRVPPAMFAKQLAWLKRHGWQFAFLSELGRADLPAKTVAITFDDGYRDNLLAAHPILAEHGAKATLFLVVNRHDVDWSATHKAHHDEGELMREEKLSDPEVMQMLASGHWEIGAHTVNHKPLPSLDRDGRRAETLGGREALEGKFSVRVQSFAYPFGLFDDEDVALAGDAGYSFAVTTEAGISRDIDAEALRLKRVKVSGIEGMFAFALRMRTGRRGVKG